MPLVGTMMKKQLRRRATQRHDGRPCTQAWRSSRALSSSHGGKAALGRWKLHGWLRV